MKAFVIATVFIWLSAPSATARNWGNASCSGHREYRKGNAVQYGKKHCDLLVGDPHNIGVLQRRSIPDGERLLVLGMSQSLEGYDHGDSWYKVKTRDGRTGYVDYTGVKCDGAPDSCKAKVVA